MIYHLATLHAFKLSESTATKYLMNKVIWDKAKKLEMLRTIEENIVIVEVIGFTALRLDLQND